MADAQEWSGNGAHGAGQCIGYLLSAEDNDGFMFQGDEQPPGCPHCGFVTDRSWVNPSFRLAPRHAVDVSYTYDGCLIVSDRFRVVASRFSGADYTPLPSQPGWCVMTALQTVPFDSRRRKTRYEDWCSACERWTQVAGATPVFLVDPPTPLPDRFLRTDVEFGSGDEQHPLVLVGPGLARALDDKALSGLEMMKILL